jgi:hypothetical protein
MANDPELQAMGTINAALEPLEDDARTRVLRWAAAKFDVAVDMAGTTSAGATIPGGLGGGGTTGSSLGTPRAFLAAKKPTTDVERVTCLAYYLTHAREKPHFKTTELVELNTEAAGAKISNPSQTTGNAKDRNGFLADAGSGNRQITPLGEAVVDALPSREAVTAAIAAAPKKARRRPGPKKKSGANNS